MSKNIPTNNEQLKPHIEIMIMSAIQYAKNIGLTTVQIDGFISKNQSTYAEQQEISPDLTPKIQQMVIKVAKDNHLDTSLNNLEESSRAPEKEEVGS